MITAPIAGWLDVLWEAVCLRAARPIPGVLVDAPGIQKIANTTFEGFLEAGGKPEASLQAMLSVLTQPVRALALEHIAARRQSENDADLLRDLKKAKWQTNPGMPYLIARGAEGQLIDKGWSLAEPVLWQRASGVYRRLRINESDARDVYSETIADFLKARPDPGDCPMRKMLVFEELPRLFAVVAERRAISWVRKQTTLKMQPNKTGLSFDDIDLALPEPRSLEKKDPLANASFDQIRASCGEALDDFEWHLLETLFVDGSKTRDELVLEDWTLRQIEVDPGASRSTKLRRLNGVVADALARLGRALENADL